MPKVMLIEDDDIMISLLKTLLEIEGYEIVVFSLGENLSDAVRLEDPALVMLDVHLRDQNGREIDGFELLDEIRREPEFDHVKIIVSSGMNFTEKCKEVGANGFIHKPYMPVELIKLIKNNIS